MNHTLPQHSRRRYRLLATVAAVTMLCMVLSIAALQAVAAPPTHGHPHIKDDCPINLNVDTVKVQSPEVTVQLSSLPKGATAEVHLISFPEDKLKIYYHNPGSARFAKTEHGTETVTASQELKDHPCTLKATKSLDEGMVVGVYALVKTADDTEDYFMVSDVYKLTKDGATKLEKPADDHHHGPIPVRTDIKLSMDRKSVKEGTPELKLTLDPAPAKAKGMVKVVVLKQDKIEAFKKNPKAKSIDAVSHASLNVDALPAGKYDMTVKGPGDEKHPALKIGDYVSSYMEIEEEKDGKHEKSLVVGPVYQLTTNGVRPVDSEPLPVNHDVKLIVDPSELKPGATHIHMTIDPLAAKAAGRLALISVKPNQVDDIKKDPRYGAYDTVTHASLKMKPETGKGDAHTEELLVQANPKHQPLKVGDIVVGAAEIKVPTESRDAGNHYYVLGDFYEITENGAVPYPRNDNAPTPGDDTPAPTPPADPTPVVPAPDPAPAHPSTPPKPTPSVHKGIPRTADVSMAIPVVALGATALLSRMVLRRKKQ